MPAVAYCDFGSKLCVDVCNVIHGFIREGEEKNMGLEYARLSGEDKNIMVLTEDGIDVVELTMLLRKNLGSFELLSVRPVEYGGEPSAKKLPLKAIFTENVLSREDKNIMVLTGDGIDVVELTMLLRKNLGSFELLSVGPVEYGGEPSVKKLPLKAIFTENV
ncbi:hypothetical protein Vadar_003563 [Vaccinium darrowii]|uniref:Uncharacterized protein n=1 Tax=Vaccinium darrowii TaxID=229202 RepID=A0ACB7YCI6_9ERIC|nr:hypothetical protein Vadar_003563 [Vaccinium darrowii]